MAKNIFQPFRELHVAIQHDQVNLTQRFGCVDGCKDYSSLLYAKALFSRIFPLFK